MKRGRVVTVTEVTRPVDEHLWTSNIESLEGTKDAVGGDHKAKPVI